MQVGSIVECLTSDWVINRDFDFCYPEKGKIYTIRGFDCNDEDYIFLEEIVNPCFAFQNGAQEPSFLVTGFRELMPPMEINLEEILELEMI